SKPRPPKISRYEMWPLDSSNADWFTRDKLRVDSVLLKRREDFQALWIAKADALPDDWHTANHQIVWASGVLTWKKLAQRGIWVNGCADSLGEQEPTSIETLTGEALDWLKLTHESGYTEGEMPILATYHLVPKDE